MIPFDRAYLPARYRGRQLHRFTLPTDERQDLGKRELRFRRLAAFREPALSGGNRKRQLAYANQHLRNTEPFRGEDRPLIEQLRSYPANRRTITGSKGVLEACY